MGRCLATFAGRVCHILECFCWYFSRKCGNVNNSTSPGREHENQGFVAAEIISKTIKNRIEDGVQQLNGQLCQNCGKIASIMEHKMDLAGWVAAGLARWVARRLDGWLASRLRGCPG